MKYFKRLAVTAFAAAALGLGASSALQAQEAPPGDAVTGKRPLSCRRLLHLPRPFRSRRRLQRSGTKPCQDGDAVRRI
jgi:hypothetical protein